MSVMTGSTTSDLNIPSSAQPTHTPHHLHQNILILQKQLYALQIENSNLIKSFSLKENYIQLKDQQVRRMQQRLDELEKGLATWKEKYNALIKDRSPTDGPEICQFPEQCCKHKNSKMNWQELQWDRESDAYTHVQLEECLSLSDREQIDRNLEKLLSHGFESISEGIFIQNANSELQKFILAYVSLRLKETFVSTENLRFENFSIWMRSLTTLVSDFKLRYNVSNDKNSIASKNSLCALQLPEKANNFQERDSQIVQNESAELLTPNSTISSSAIRNSKNGRNDIQTITTTENRVPASHLYGKSMDSQHVFDCVNCSLIPSQQVGIQHGLRELHPNKAVYISKPIHTDLSDTHSINNDKRSRRYSHVLRSQLKASDTTHIRTLSQASATSTLTDLHDEDDLISAPSFSNRNEPRKIKKIVDNVVGNVKDRFQRQRNGIHASSARLASENMNVEEMNVTCYGCGRNPIHGWKWICRTCRIEKEQEYELCDKCYGHGLHGKEQDDELFTRIRDIVVTKCPVLKEEYQLIKLLQVGICKANLKKFSFCLTWIADLLQCRQTKDLRARALEISQISPQVRSVFVRLLTDLLERHRSDIELKTEWEPLQSSIAGKNDGHGNTGSLQLDTLRIWVTDAVKV